MARLKLYVMLHVVSIIFSLYLESDVCINSLLLRITPMALGLRDASIWVLFAWCLYIKIRSLIRNSIAITSSSQSAFFNSRSNDDSKIGVAYNPMCFVAVLSMQSLLLYYKWWKIRGWCVYRGAFKIARNLQARYWLSWRY